MMNSKDLKFRFALLLGGLYLLLSAQAATAQFVIRGIGLSGSGTVLDSVVQQGNDIFVVLEVVVPTDWTIESVGFDGGAQFEIQAYYYSIPTPFGEPVSISTLTIDPEDFAVNDGVDPQRVIFRTPLPEVLGQQIRSLQIATEVIGTDGDGVEQRSETFSSFIAVEEFLPVNNPIDPQHRAYLTIEPVSASEPVIHEPVDDDTLNRNFLVRYDLPLNARRRTLQLEVRETPEIGGLLVHRLFLADTLAATGNELQVNALNLLATPGVDSLGGTNSLNHESRVELRLYYVRADNGGQSDTARVRNLFLDALTESPTLVEPRVGSSLPSPGVRVIYSLPEPASLVQLIFDVDSVSVDSGASEPDPLSPHILTLVPELYAAQEHYFVLDGTNIGTGGPYVFESNNGLLDELVSQAIYNVTLSYRDLAGNPAALTTNGGYIWPEDLTTIPPRMIAPAPNASDNSSFWVEFELPEQPLMGSVYVLFTPLVPSPNPIEVYLGNLSSSGIRGLFLNALALDLSGPPVTHVEGDNHLTDGTRYSVRVFYQDFYGNPEAGAVAHVARFDGSTAAPTLLTPPAFDTLAYTGTEVTYYQPERASPGTLKLVLDQTGGPELDLLSPHTLFLSDPDLGSQKSVIIHPSFLGPGEGVDSVRNAGSLVSRGRYRLTISYQDVLLNTEASDFVTELIFPSGSNVFVRGGTLGADVIPGGRDLPLLYLAFSADNESALRELELEVAGGLEAADVVAREFILWSSVDTVLQTDLDTPLDSLDSWIAGNMHFDSLVFPIGAVEHYVIVSGRFSATANAAHKANLVLRDGAFADCGGDPVYCTECPIGEPDVALPVEVSRMFVEQDTSFGALVVNWIVESEHNTLGFRLWRSDPTLEGEVVAASYTEHAELYGRGTAATAKRYSFVDRGLVAGQTYTYRVDAIGMDGLTAYPVALEASGIPAAPPDEFELRNVYPNPFNQEAFIEFVAPIAQVVELKVYNILGQPVRTLVQAQLAPSAYRVRWDATNDGGRPVPSGVYIVRLHAAGRYDSALKLLLVR